MGLTDEVTGQGGDFGSRLKVGAHGWKWSPGRKVRIKSNTRLRADPRAEGRSSGSGPILGLRADPRAEARPLNRVCHFLPATNEPLSSGVDKQVGGDPLFHHAERTLMEISQTARKPDFSPPRRSKSHPDNILARHRVKFRRKSFRSRALTDTPGVVVLDDLVEHPNAS